MIGIIIQARMGAKRLPGKVMKEILGRPLLFYSLERLKRIAAVDKIVVATTTEPADQAIYDYARELGVESFRGSEDDVLDRYYQAARAHGLGVVIRLTADCPLIDPDISSEIIRFYLDNRKLDAVRTGPSYPEGFDTEIFNFKSLDKAWRKAELKSEREHVTPYIWKNEGQFNLKVLEFDRDLSQLRLTVDEASDWTVVSNVFENLYHENPDFRLKDILKLYDEKPELFSANQNIKRNEGYAKSLAEDKIMEARL
ncbi:MAG: glycosyltransferase family protein [Candidatus Margulisbacteria bacterium]|nr:glycosyltransferase family protein [Candidatus Margulisiibacteriota bacterium]